MLGACVFYAGVLLIVTGTISLLQPLSFLRIRNRRRAILVIVTGGVVAIGGLLFPETDTTVSAVRCELDRFLPTYQFHEIHAVRVAAPRERVYAAIKSVTADDIPFFHTLTWIRRGGQATSPSILNPPNNTPILDVAMSTSFLLLAEDPDREIVLGTAVVVPRGWRPQAEPTPDTFKAALSGPGFALAAMNFTVQDDGPNACLVTTETRVDATDARTRSAFRRYWHVIYPGSAFLRRMWLLAIRRRAERPS